MGLSLLTQSLGIPTGLSGWQVLKKQSVASFTQFTNDPVLKAQIAYFTANIGKATSVSALMQDTRLQDVAYTAFGLSAQIGANGFMSKVFNSDLSNKTSLANQLVAGGYKAIAAAFNYNGFSIPASPAAASSAVTTVSQADSSDTFSNFSGTFGGVTLQNVDLSAATTPQKMAAALNNAFQNADGGRSDITVTYVGDDLHFNDARGRGAAANFSWTPNPSDTSAPTMTDPTNLVNGHVAIAAAGGANVKDPTFVAKVVDQYKQAMFDKLVGGSSATLGNALYAQQQLPSVTNWYSVIADTKLATVVETALNLPDSFKKLNVDQQNAILKSKMDVKDLANPTKLGKLLNKYVAIGSATEAASSGSNSPAVSLLNDFFNGGSSNTMSSGSAAALILSTS